MKSIRLILVVALCILLGALFFTPLSVSAQEVTVEPTLELTEVEQPVDPVVVVRDTSTALTELIAAFLAGGLVVGGGVLLTLRSLIRLFSDNPALNTAVERLYMSQPIGTRERIRPAVETGKELFTLLDQLTDGELAGVQAQVAALREDKASG